MKIVELKSGQSWPEKFVLAVARSTGGNWYVGAGDDEAEARADLKAVSDGILVSEVRVFEVTL